MIQLVIHCGLQKMKSMQQIDLAEPLTMGIANRAVNLKQKFMLVINIAEAFASANNKNLN
jgi:hypothetical protein